MNVTWDHDPKTESLLQRVAALLDSGRAESAIDLLTRDGSTSPAARNARGVCLMRLGHHRIALKLFQQLVYPNDALTMDPATPTVLRVNLATALFLCGDPMVGSYMLHCVRDRRHPAYIALDQAVRKWRRSQPLWRRALMLVGAYPVGPVPLALSPGWLWLDDDARRFPSPRKRAA
jgi:hypothetical protein